MVHCPFPYVPSYVDEELLFSWISRLHITNGESDSRKTLYKLFGSSTGIPSADLPCRLQNFLNRMAGRMPFNSVASLALGTTLFPYFAFFLDKKRYNDSLACLAGDRGDRLKIGLGLVANGFGASTIFRSCAACDLASMERNGCEVLRRIHQLPSVLVCPLHGDTLSYSFVQSHQAHRQQLFLPIKKTSEKITQLDSKGLRRIAALSSEILTLQPPFLSSSTRKAVYLEGLTARGFTRSNRIDWDLLANELREEYENFTFVPFRERLLSTDRCPMRWVHDLCGRPERSLHPLCHLLFVGLVFGSVQNYISCAKKFNTTVPSFSASDMDANGQVRNNHKNIAVLTNQALTCRQVAKETGLSTTTIVAQRRALGIPISERRKTILQLKLEQTKKLLTEGWPIAEIARAMHFSLSSVYRILAVLKNVQDTRSASFLQSKKLRYRTQWMDAKSFNPEAGTKQLRLLTAGAYQWLYRHDSAWLAGNLPHKRSASFVERKSHIDWDERDNALAIAVEGEAKRVASDQGGNRLSELSLLQATGCEASARKNLHRLPKLARVLTELAEDDHKFCVRRRNHALVCLEQMGIHEPEKWRVQRTSRLRKRKSEEGS